LYCIVPQLLCSLAEGKGPRSRRLASQAAAQRASDCGARSRGHPLAASAEDLVATGGRNPSCRVDGRWRRGGRLVVAVAAQRLGVSSTVAASQAGRGTVERGWESSSSRIGDPRLRLIATLAYADSRSRVSRRSSYFLLSVGSNNLAQQPSYFWLGQKFTCRSRS